MLHTQLAALALTAPVLAFYSCGGSSKSATQAGTATATTASAIATIPAVTLATDKPLTRASWIAKGDAICEPVNREVGAISIRSTAEYARFIPQIALYYRTEATELSKLTPPASMRQDAERLVGGIQLLSEYLERSGNSFRAGYAASGRQLFQTALIVQKQPLAIARRDGFKKCTAAN